MKMYLPNHNNYIIIASTCLEANEVYEHLLTKINVHNIPKQPYFFKEIPVPLKGEKRDSWVFKALPKRECAGYFPPHEEAIYGEKGICNGGNWVHYNCDKYESKFIEVSTRRTIIKGILSDLS